MFPDDVNVVGVIILELVIKAEVELKAEEDESEQSPEGGGDPGHPPRIVGLTGSGSVGCDLRGQCQKM